MSTKRRFVLYVIYAILGVALITVANFVNMSQSLQTYLASFGTALLAINVIKMLRFRAILADQEKAREYDTRMTEERTVFLVRRARSIVFYVSLMVQLLLAVVFQLLDQPVISQVFCYLTAAQGIGYFIVWRYLDSKY